MNDTSDAQMIRCPQCNAVNRVPRERLRHGRQPVCGRCKAFLRASSEPITVTDATFPDDVERSPVPVLLDLWAPWCGPCKMIAPALEELASEMAGRVRVAKMNVDENPITSQRFQIRGIPSLLVFKGGREVDRIVGAQPKSEIARRLARAIA
jgi:thioredoxin 2